ncbi:MAG: anti-sigma factor [Tildeniella nuda ZEHNDER 1965/U140]|jgi:anti-sigma-K factor RskA|nr:anti-sigma factor [Tildeniella nuda ZEHNDER 1965/U140]
MNAEDRCFCELAPLYALNLLDDDERHWVEAQILENPELATELAEHQTTVNALPYGTPAVPMAADLKDRLFQRLAEEPADPPPLIALPTRPNQSFQDEQSIPASAPMPVSGVRDGDSRVMPFRRRTEVWLQAAGAIAALAAIALLVDNYRLRQRVQADQAIVATLQQPDSIVYTLRGTEQAATASGSLVVNPGEKTAVVLVQNLPALPEGKAYRLWAIPKGATKPTYCGEFNNSSTGTVQWSLPEVECSASAPQMLITAESVTAPPVPAGPLVMKSMLRS